MIDILVCTDNNYIIPLASLLSSLKKTAKNSQLTIHWFALEVSDFHIKQISNLAEESGCKIKVYKFLKSKISTKFYTSGRITSAAYLRLYLADKIKNVRKILYLDCDMIALGDLKSLWLNHIDDNIAAVVRDSTNINLAHLGNLAPNNYFNSGMMLININQWRNKDIQSELFKYLNENIHFRFHDQDLLNLALHERVVFIDNKWNLIPSRENAKKIFVYSLIFRLGLSKLFKLNGIIHFAASKKPWHYLSSHPFKFLWWKHLKGTQFRDFVSEDKNVFNFFFKICPKPLRFLFFK